MVKNQPVRSDGLTFRQAIRHALPPEPSAGDPVARTLPLLEEIERDLPLLTIMVPELPENSFSAEKWDVATQVPLVGLRVWSDKGVPLIMANGEENHVPFGHTPGFPVVVVKDNERVTTAQKPDELTFKAPGNDYYFRFVHENFKNLGARSGRAALDNPDQKLLDAATIMDPVEGWHRDYIYYNLTPSQTKGPFRLDFRERITSFYFIRADAYGRIAEQPGDPRYVSSVVGRNYPIYEAAWTDGSFDFLVNAVVGSKLGLPPSKSVFSAKGYELFHITYNRRPLFAGISNFYVFTIDTIYPTAYNPQRVDLIPWDLDKYAPSMYVSFVEMDVSETTTVEQTKFTEFAGNFEVSGEILKVGLKFGVSAKKTFESKSSIVSSRESDDLGTQTVEFGEKVFLGPNPFSYGTNVYDVLDYSTGTVLFTVVPSRQTR